MTNFRFEWPYEGKKVFVAGDFNNWQLSPITTEFELKNKYYEYIFFVDGKWCYDICKPSVSNIYGGKNNLLNMTNKIKIIHMSDTHSSYPEITDCADIFIHTGDFSIGGHPEEYRIFNDWIGTIKIPTKIVILGNHDLDYYNDDGTIGKKLLTNAIILNTEEIKVHGIRFFGIQWHKFNTWNFMSQTDHQNEHLAGWNRIPENIDFLLTHHPPHGILDDDTHHWGSYGTLQSIKRMKPKYHLFGHIHQAYGNKEIDIDGHKIKFYNSSLMDEFSNSLINKYQIIYY